MVLTSGQPADLGSTGATFCLIFGAWSPLFSDGRFLPQLRHD